MNLQVEGSIAAEKLLWKVLRSDMRVRAIADLSSELIDVEIQTGDVVERVDGLWMKFKFKVEICGSVA